MTADLGFANVLRFPPGTHAGIVVVRAPTELPTPSINELVARSLAGLDRAVLAGALLSVEPGRVRIRRPPEGDAS